MATAEERGATATTTETTNSSYGGGAGGKFRKKPSRRQTTPYDRPPTAFRPDNNNSSSSVGWLTKLVVDSASKIISYGTNRFFGPILRRQLPPPPLPPQAPDVNHDLGEDFVGSVPNELTVAKSSQPIDSSNSNGISELEKLLKQNTFTRSEIVHLTELLHSRASEASPAGEREKMERPSVFGRHDENQNEGIISHGATTSTPIFNSRVHEKDIGSPAELAKAYMDSRTSKVSPSMLGVNSQVGREDTGLLNSVPFTSNLLIVPFTRKSTVSFGAAENGYVTPRSRGRSAIYNMARTPYSRVNPTSIMKGNGNKNYDFGSSMPSSPLSISEYGEKIESKSTTLKRRSSFLEDEVGSGSVGPIRRIRQKQNLLVPRAPHTAKQKLPLIGKANHDRLKAVVESGNGSAASTSYAAGPSRSREVASRIFQHLEELSPKEKSPGSKFVTARDKSSKFMLNGKDDSKIEDNSNANLHDARESTSQNQEKVGETGCKESVAPLELWSSAKKNESVMPLKDVTSNSLVRNGASQPPQKKRAFRTSAQVDGDVHVSKPLSEKKGPMEESNLSTGEDPKSMKTTIQPEVNSTPGFGFSKTSEFSVSSSGVALTASEETSKASQSAVVPPVYKPKENPPPLFFFSSNVGDKLPSEFSSRKPEPKLDNSRSFFNISAPNGPQLKTTESDNGDLNHPKSASNGLFGKSDTAAASNGLFGKSDTAAASNGLFGKSDTAAASNGLFGSTITANLASTGTSTSTTSFGITFGSATLAPATTSAGLVVKFGSSSTDPSPSTNNMSQVTGSTTKPVENQTFANSQPIVSPFSPPSSRNNIFGGSLFNNAKSNASGEEPAPSQGSAQPVSSTSPFGSSFSNSQPSNSKPASLFGSSSSSPDTNSMAPVTSNSNSSPGIFSFGFSSSSASTNSIGSSSAATSSPFIFGNSSPAPASASNTSSSFSTGASGIFNFGGSSTAPMNSISSSGTPSNNEFTSSISGSTSNSSNPSTGFTFGSSPKPVAPTNTALSIFSSPSPASSSPIFSVGAASAPALSTPSQPIFGNSASGFGASFGDNNDQMNGEDSMVEDPVQSTTPAPVFGQLAVNSSPPGFMFGQTAPVQANPFQFGGQTSQVAPNPFQASSSLEFNAGGSGFSLGSGGGGGDKSNRRTVRVSKSRNRKK